MELDPGVCMRAAASRDPRFDGRFLVGVVTTGVYCRPQCPGRAKPENVRFHASIGSARRAGLRACLRCKPDAEAWRPASQPLSLRGAGGTIELPHREPLAWDDLLAFLGQRAVPGLEEVSGRVYRRGVRTAAGPALVEVQRLQPGRLSLQVRDGTTSDLVGAARRAFDLEANPQAIADDLAEDALLAPLVARRPGLRVPGAWDPFELAVRAVLGQQVSVAAARTIAGRVVQRFGDALAPPVGAVTHAFPRAAALTSAPLEELGLPRARAATIRGVALAVVDGRLDLDEPDPDRLRARLLDLAGVGPWTAEYVAMRALGDPDAFPAADLGVRHALSGPAGLPTVREVELLAAPWRPWRSYAVMHLWAALGDRDRAAA